jgi:hypothetical protein
LFGLLCEVVDELVAFGEESERFVGLGVPESVEPDRVSLELDEEAGRCW